MSRHRGKLPLLSAICIAALALPVAALAQTHINQIPQPPAVPPLPHGPLLIYGLYNWLLTAGVAIWLCWESYRTRSAFPLAFLAGGALAAYVEPVFDGNIHVLFVYPPGVHPSWRFYNVPYPWYEFAGNSCLAGPVYWMYLQFQRGVSARALWAYFFIWWVFDGLQELPGTIMGTYLYYGPQPYEVGNWPVWVGMLAGLGFPLAAYAAYAMRDVLAGPPLWATQVILMPVVIYGCEVIAWPMWITLNGGQSLLVTHFAAVASLLFEATAYYLLILVYRRSWTARATWRGSALPA